MKVADISRAFLEYRDFNLERPATDVKTANFLRKIEDALKSHQGDEAATGTVLLELGKRAANRTKCVLLDKTRIDNSNLGDDEDKKLVAKSRTEILDDKVMAPTENCRLNDLDDRIVIFVCTGTETNCENRVVVPLSQSASREIRMRVYTELLESNREALCG